MIDEERLLASIEYSSKWNNKPCPGWVIKLIKAQPTLQERDSHPVVEIWLNGKQMIDVLETEWTHMLNGDNNG